MMNSKKALIFYGGWDGHTPLETATLFKNILTDNGYSVTMTDDLAQLDDYDQIKEYDLFVPVWTMGEITSQQCDNVARAVADGAGMAGCHGGMCDAFRNNTQWQFMTGSRWVAHPGNDKVTYKVCLKNDNEFTKGLSDFELTSEQYYLHVDPAIKVHATTVFEEMDAEHSANGKIEMPVVYTKKWGKGKIFYCSIGHTYRELEIEEVKTIMERGLIWAAR